MTSAAEIGRVEELPLQLGADPAHDAGADLALALQGGGHGLQETITIANVERLGGGEHGVEFVVGEPEG